ncbi:hypothetical protein Zm00014a_016622 [Zea mays]|uniref:Uncharacterized protein n=1 Tax=Zea mays TaxID=4577 RepID=A0A3L6DAI1_MAIZE|nr:hypothetical protein Zm00014a_016622 [Zea mays]
MDCIRWLISCGVCRPIELI